MSDARNLIRGTILASDNYKRDAIELDFFGAQIELRQPTTGDILRYTDSNSNALSLISILLDYAYVPGTNEKVFEEGDVEELKQLPYNKDMQALIKAIERFTNVMISDAEKN